MDVGSETFGVNDGVGNPEAETLLGESHLGGVADLTVGTVRILVHRLDVGVAGPEYGADLVGHHKAQIFHKEALPGGAFASAGLVVFGEFGRIALAGVVVPKVAAWHKSHIGEVLQSKRVDGNAGHPVFPILDDDEGAGLDGRALLRNTGLGVDCQHT